MRPKKCPECKSTEIAKIVYGYPVQSIIDEEQKEGPIELGGCCVTDNDPEYSCQSCDHVWGRANHHFDDPDA